MFRNKYKSIFWIVSWVTLICASLSVCQAVLNISSGRIHTNFRRCSTFCNLDHFLKIPSVIISSIILDFLITLTLTIQLIAFVWTHINSIALVMQYSTKLCISVTTGERFCYCSWLSGHESLEISETKWCLNSFTVLVTVKPMGYTAHV
jgi:hypothetical protein